MFPQKLHIHSFRVPPWLFPSVVNRIPALVIGVRMTKKRHVN
jgi:hypothetical protein